MQFTGMDEIEIAEADPLWPDRFHQERAALLETLADLDVEMVEHFGSTAIPGLAAKPIIDILVIVPSLASAKAAFVPRLAKIGYAYWADNPKMDRLFFVKGLPPDAERRTHHVHVAERSSEMMDRLLFRDYLIANPDEARRYGKLKRELAARYAADREAYTRGKDDYVEHVMRLARASGLANET